MFNRMFFNWIPGLRDIQGGEPESPVEPPIQYQLPAPTKFYFIKYDLPHRLHVKKGVNNVAKRSAALKEMETACAGLLESVWMTGKELNLIVEEQNRFKLNPVRFMSMVDSSVEIYWLDPVIKITFKSENSPSTQSIIESIMRENQMPISLRPNDFSVKGLKSLKGTRFFEARITMKSFMRTLIDDGFIRIFGQRIRFYDCIFKYERRCVSCHSLEHHYVDCPIFEPICFWCGYRRHDGDCIEPKICIFCPAVNRQNADHHGDNPITCRMNQKAINVASSYFGHKYTNFYLNPRIFRPRDSTIRPLAYPNNLNPNWTLYMNPNLVNYQSAIDNQEVPTSNKRKRF